MFNNVYNLISDNNEYIINISKEKLLYSSSDATYKYIIKFISIIDNITQLEIITNNIEIMNLIDTIENYLYGNISDTFCCIKSYIVNNTSNTLLQITRGNIDNKDYCNTYISLLDYHDDVLDKRLMFISNTFIHKLYTVLKESICYDLIENFYRNLIINKNE